MSVAREPVGMSRVRNAAINFALNFLLGYVGGTLLRDRETGLRAGVVLGAVGAIGGWRLSDRVDDSDDGGEPIEIEI
jgi:uncharacterized membrane protein YeaQ/YmgE (transglycosylase-associated protein family)